MGEDATIPWPASLEPDAPHFVLADAAVTLLQTRHLGDRATFDEVLAAWRDARTAWLLAWLAIRSNET